MKPHKTKGAFGQRKACEIIKLFEITGFLGKAMDGLKIRVPQFDSVSRHSKKKRFLRG
jgi:hypothetical protein